MQCEADRPWRSDLMRSAAAAAATFVTDLRHATSGAHELKELQLEVALVLDSECSLAGGSTGRLTMVDCRLLRLWIVLS